MPEAPDLHVIRELITERIAGREVTAARVLRPTVLRSLASRDFPSDIVGRSVGSIDRRGKYLLLSLSGGLASTKDNFLIRNKATSSTVFLRSVNPNTPRAVVSPTKH